MLSPDDIIRALHYLADHYVNVAISWHIIIYGFLLFILIAKRKVTNRLIGGLLSLPVFSVSIFAWQIQNPFNGTLFLILGMLLFVFSFKVKSQRIVVNPSFAIRASGIAILLSGLIYPHFLGQEFSIYLYAAPTGIIPCPTLLMITGFSLIFLLKQSYKWMMALLVADVLYGLLGVFLLGVELDIMLLLASALLFSQMLRQKYIENNQHKIILSEQPKANLNA
jgi:hypothetical protein